MTRAEATPAARQATKQIFVPGVGQHDNIGDIILRRQLLDMLRPLGRLHVYVGASPAGYDDALGLAADDVVYRSFAHWYRVGLAAALAGDTAYVFKPGEIQLTLLGMKEHIGMLPLLLLLRVCGGRAIRIGVGSRNFAAVPRMLMKPSIALSDLTLWRDTGTAEHMRSGGLMPDLAFGEGSSAPSDANGDGARTVLAVSMRYDRAYPTTAWFGAVRQFAAERGLEIVTVTQVLRDNDKSVRLARDLGGTALEWDGTDHGAHEEKLRVLYRRSSIVVSDRLHVLVGALTEGALPAGLLVGSSDKISRHFAAAGITDIAMSSDGARQDDLCHHLDTVLSRSGEIFAGLDQARVELDGVRSTVERILGGTAKATTLARRGRFARFARFARFGRPASGRPPVSAPEQVSAEPVSAEPATAYHVGRRGEVAGGMTQVVNSYLEQDFDAFRIRVIESRNGSAGLPALLVFLTAVRRVLAVRRDRPAVFVVHLSQGGSFVREGALLRLAALRGFGTVAQLHGSSFAVFSRKHPHLVRWVLSAASAVHALSDETAAAVGVSVPSVPCTIIANAVPGGRDSTKEKLIVFGGAVTHRKGVDVLLDAWRALPENAEWALEIVGPVLEPEVVRGELPNAAVRGSLPHDELMAMLDRSSIAVLPSRDEAMPMFIIEAMARSNAVIATRVGGIPAVLSDNAGLLIDPDDTTALAAALSALIDDPTLRGSVAQAGHARFEEQFSAAVIRPQLEALWTIALRRQLPAAPTSGTTTRTKPTTLEGSPSLP